MRRGAHQGGRARCAPEDAYDEGAIRDGEAEAAGWDGVFVWDQVRWHEPVLAVADPQITLASVAVATERIRLGLDDRRRAHSIALAVAAVVRLPTPTVPSRIVSRPA